MELLVGPNLYSHLLCVLASWRAVPHLPVRAGWLHAGGATGAHRGSILPYLNAHVVLAHMATSPALQPTESPEAHYQVRNVK